MSVPDRVKRCSLSLVVGSAIGAAGWLFAPQVAAAAPGTLHELGCNRSGQLHYLSMGYAEISWTDSASPLKGYIEVNGGEVKATAFRAVVSTLSSSPPAAADAGKRIKYLEPTESPRIAGREGKNNVVRIPVWLEGPRELAPSSASFTLLIETARGSRGCHISPPH